MIELFEDFYNEYKDMELDDIRKADLHGIWEDVQRAENK